MSAYISIHYNVDYCCWVFLNKSKSLFDYTVIFFMINGHVGLHPRYTQKDCCMYAVHIFFIYELYRLLLFGRLYILKSLRWVGYLCCSISSPGCAAGILRSLSIYAVADLEGASPHATNLQGISGIYIN